MSAISNIVAFDGASTPVTHTLVATSVSKEKGVVVAVWTEKVASLPEYAQIKLTMKMEKLKSGVFRVEERLEVPVMESVSGQNSSGYTAAPKVAYIDTQVIVGLFHERGTIAGRRLCRQMGLNIHGGIATSVAPVTTGPAAELFDLLVAPT